MNAAADKKMETKETRNCGTSAGTEGTCCHKNKLVRSEQKVLNIYILSQNAPAFAKCLMLDVPNASSTGTLMRTTRILLCP